MSLHALLGEAKRQALGMYGQVISYTASFIRRLRMFTPTAVSTYAVNEGGKGTGEFDDVEMIIISDDTVKLVTSSKGYIEYKKPVGILYSTGSKIIVEDIAKETQVACMDSNNFYYMKASVVYDNNYNMYDIAVEPTNKVIEGA